MFAVIMVERGFKNIFPDDILDSFFGKPDIGCKVLEPDGFINESNEIL